MAGEEMFTCTEGFWHGNLEKRGQMEDLGVDGRIILTP
jgi:hypothetical protein